MSAEWTAVITASAPEDLAAAISLGGLAYADQEGNFVCTASMGSSAEWAPEEGEVVAGGFGVHIHKDGWHMGKGVACVGGMDAANCTGEGWSCTTNDPEDPDAEPMDMEEKLADFKDVLDDEEGMTEFMEDFKEACPDMGNPFTLVSAGMNADEPPTGNFDAMWTMPMGDMKIGDTANYAWMGMCACSVDGDDPELCGAWTSDWQVMTVVQGASAIQVASAGLAAYLLF